MSDSAGELSVEINGKDVNLTALLDRIEKQLTKTEQTGQRAGRGIGEGVGGGAAQGANGALQLQRAMASLEVAQGNVVGAAERLRNALAQQNTTTVQTIAAQKQLIATEKQLEQSSTGAAKYVAAFKDGLAGFVAPAAAAQLALNGLIAAGQSFVDAFNFKAELDASTTAINTNLQGMRNSTQVWREATSFADKYRLTQKETNDILSSSTDILRVSSSSVSDLEANLLRLQSRDVSKPISEAARALRELQAGDTTSIKELFNVPAREANRMKAEIQGGGDAVKVLGGYLDRAGVGMQTLENRAKGVKGAMNDAAIAQERLALAQAKLAEGPGVAVTNYKTNVLEDLTALLTFDWSVVSRGADANRIAIEARNKALDEGKSKIEADAVFAQVHAQVMREGAAAVETNTQAVYQNAVSMDAERQGITATIQAAQQAYEAHLTHASALQEDAAKALLAAANSDELSIAKQRLAGQAQAAAQAVLAGGGNIAATAARLAASSSQVDQLTAAYIRLAQAQGAAGAAAAANRVPSDAARAMGIAQQTSAALGRQRQLMTPLQQAQRDLAAAQNLYGKGSLQAYEAETKLLAARQAAAKQGRGAGQATLSDQQKLTTSLLAGQEQYQNQVEDAEAKHLQNRLRIEQDFQEKLRQAQAQFDQDQLDGRAGFYDQLGSIESARIRQSASAAYEAAAAEAGKIAAEQGADVADKYMQAQEKVISDRAKRQAEIEKAAKSGDAGQAEYLRGVDRLHQQAEDARLARIKQDDDSLAAQRDTQLAEEQAQYAQQQDKIGQAADRAADRKIAAAERAGKKIDEEQLKVDKLASTYDKIAAPSAAGTPATAAPAAPAGATPAATSAPGQASPNADVVAALSGAQAAIVAALGAVERASKETAGAVRGLKNSGGIAG